MAVSFSALFAAPALADINVGVTLSATGPAASLGIPEKNTFELLPTTIGGEKINWIVLDDASDTTKAVHERARSWSRENKVDVIVGSTITPNSLAMVDVAADGETPMISMAASARIVDPANPKTRWVFKTPQNDALMADAIAVSMKANGVKTMGYIGFADAYGDGWLAEIKRSAQTAGIKVVAEEKYNRNDPSVDGSGAEARLRQPGRDPDRRRRHAGRHAAEGAGRARLQGEDLPDARRGAIRTSCAWSARTATARCCPTGPMLVYEQLPDSNPIKKVAAEYITAVREEVRHAHDIRRPRLRHLPAAGEAPSPRRSRRASRARRSSAPRCATRSRRRTSLATHGVFVMNANDHNGLDNRARVMVRIDDGKWMLAK